MISRRDPTACRQCGTTSTPLWRYGPEGSKSLCNACGIRWKRAQKGGKLSIGSAGSSMSISSNGGGGSGGGGGGGGGIRKRKPDPRRERSHSFTSATHHAHAHSHTHANAHTHTQAGSQVLKFPFEDELFAPESPSSFSPPVARDSPFDRFVQTVEHEYDHLACPGSPEEHSSSNEEEEIDEELDVGDELVSFGGSGTQSSLASSPAAWAPQHWVSSAPVAVPHDPLRRLSAVSSSAPAAAAAGPQQQEQQQHGENVFPRAMSDEDKRCADLWLQFLGTAAQQKHSPGGDQMLA